MISRVATFAWYALAVLVGLVLWVETCGRTYVEGLPLEVLEGLAGAKSLISAPQDPFYLLLSRSPMDAVFTVGLFCGLTMLGAYALIWFTGRKVWENPVSPTLAGTLLFLGADTFWIQADAPQSTLTVLVLSFAVAALISGKLPLLGLAVILASGLAPAYGVTFSLVLLYLSYVRRESYGKAVSAVTASVGVAGLLVHIFRFGLEPSLSGFSSWTWVPLLGLALSKELRESRGGLYLALALSAMVGAAPEVVSAICLGDLAVVGLRERPLDSMSGQNGSYSAVPRSRIVVGIAFVLTLAGALKGEKDLNSKILIPAQKQKVGILTLFRPFSLASHADLVGRDRWQGKSPYPALGRKEVEASRSLSGPFRVLTLDELAEARDLSLLMALLSGQPLHGWSSEGRLSTSSLTCKRAERNVVVGETVIFRKAGEVEITDGPGSPPDPTKLAPVDLLTLWSLPFRPQVLSGAKNSGYRLVASGSTETLVFTEGPAQVVFSASPDQYKLIDLKDSKNSRKIEIHPFALSLKCPELDAPLPSRSLVEIDFVLTNTGQGPVTHRELKSVTLGVLEGESFSPFEQLWPDNVVLFPQESMAVKLWLATPEREDEFRMKASFKSIDGHVFELPLSGRPEFKSWRRLPAVGTWVEPE